MSKIKKWVLIGGAVVVALIAIGVGYWKLVEGNVQEMAAVQSGENQESDFVGQTDACQPQDEHQWYRSDNTLTIDPTDPQNLGVFIEKRGWFKSEDGGQSWAYSSKGIKGFRSSDSYKERPCYLEFRVASIDPTNPKRILLGALGDFDSIDTELNQAGGLLETLDGGQTWHQILTPGINAYVHDIAIDPSDPQTIYYVTSSQAGQKSGKTLLTKGIVYKTTDGGKSWTELPTGLKDNVGGQELFLNAANPSQLLVTTLAFSQGSGGRQATNDPLGLLTSNDDGASWQATQPLPGADENVLVSFVSPTNFNNMYLQSWVSEGSPRAYYSTNAGASWRRSAQVMDVVAYDPNIASGREAFGYAWQSGSTKLWHTTDAGASWHVVGTLPTDITNVQDPKQRISKIVVDPTNNDVLYLAGANANVWKSTDKGQAWTRVLTLDTLP